MQVPSFRPTTIQVNKRPGDSRGGKINRLLNTVANMENTLVHERKHVKQNQAKDTREVPVRELDAIDAQKQHSTWERTTDEYKESTKNYEDYNKKKLNNE